MSGTAVHTTDEDRGMHARIIVSLPKSVAGGKNLRKQEARMWAHTCYRHGNRHGLSTTPPPWCSQTRSLGSTERVCHVQCAHMQLHGGLETPLRCLHLKLEQVLVYRSQSTAFGERLDPGEQPRYDPVVAPDERWQHQHRTQPDIVSQPQSMATAHNMYSPAPCYFNAPRHHLCVSWS